LGFDHVEAGLLQGCRHRGGIVGRIAEPADVFVSGVADHQRNALLGVRRPAERAH